MRESSVNMTRHVGTLTKRRPTQNQGQALVILGHAIEYLMDSYVFFASADGDEEDLEAIHVLMRLNREVFAECSLVVPWRERLMAALSSWFKRDAALGD